jgi:CubicO group peptidase (beta-lactamase class C family)
MKFSTTALFALILGGVVCAADLTGEPLSATQAEPPSSKPRATIQRLDGSTVTTAEVDATVSHLIDAAHVTGAGIAIFHEGKISYLHAYGLRDTEKELPLTPDSVMTSASLNKAAFATVVMKLVEQGVVELDKPVYEYLPKPLYDYPNYADLNGDERYKKLTLRMLLSHTSGFPNWRAFTEEKKLRIFFEPGTRFAYSGEGIVLAQMVVETVTGKSATELMRNYLFLPLGMTRSSMVWEPRFEDNFANGYDQYGRSLGPERRPKPDAAGSMQTTVRDYATFLSALMQGKILDAKTTREMLRPQIRIHSAHEFPSLATETTTTNDTIELGYGLGWGLYTSGFGQAFFKEGHDDAGWRHLALCFDKTGSGVLIMTDSNNGEGIFKPLLDTLLGTTLFPFDWEGYTPYTELPPLPRLKQHKKASLSLDQLKHVTGKYILSPQVAITVSLEGGKLYVQENDEPKQEILPESPQNFYSATSTDEYSFTPENGNAARLMVLHADGKDFSLKRQD